MGAQLIGLVARSGGAMPTLTEPDYGRAIQALVDSTAHARGYLDGTTCASYAGSSVTAWDADATAFKAWRDAVWSYAYGELADVQSGARTPTPTIDEIIAELPSITWPT